MTGKFYYCTMLHRDGTSTSKLVKAKDYEHAMKQFYRYAWKYYPKQYVKIECTEFKDNP